MILASGLTGDLGRALLEQWGRPALALLRGPDFEQRSIALGRRAGVCVTPVPGDVYRPLWGIDPARIRGLRDEVSVVLNLAAETNWAARWESFDRANVMGTRHAVQLAAELGARLVHVSSLFAAYDADEIVPEQLIAERAGLTMYERSKCRAEWIVDEGRRHLGIDATIARVAGVIGDLRPAGASVRFRTPLLRLLREPRWRLLPLVPTARVDLVPRDVAGQALASLLTPDPTATDQLVHHIGMGAHAPTAGALAAEFAVLVRSRAARRFNPIPVPGAWLKKASLEADRFGRGPAAASVIGLRYLASDTVYESRMEFAGHITMTDLLRCAGLTPTADDKLTSLSTFYEQWTDSF